MKVRLSTLALVAARVVSHSAASPMTFTFVGDCAASFVAVQPVYPTTRGVVAYSTIHTSIDLSGDNLLDVDRSA